METFEVKVPCLTRKKVYNQLVDFAHIMTKRSFLGTVLLGFLTVTTLLAETNQTAQTAKDLPAEAQKEKSAELKTGKYYIDNGKVRLGIDLDRGGSVFYFAQSSTKKNILNHADEGRFIQQSYYGEPDGSVWAGNPWVWNPIQGGGSKGRKAKVRSHVLEKESLQVVSEPVNWGGDNAMPETEMEERITLEGDVAHIHYIFRNTGENAKDHPETDHELPAVFVDADYPNMVFYDGGKPWTHDKLKSVVPGWPNEAHVRTEEWGAYVNDKDWGIGVYTPGSIRCTDYRYKGSGKTGPEGDSCSYFAPLRKFAIKKGMTFEYDVYLYIGTIQEIRDTFYKLHEAQK